MVSFRRYDFSDLLSGLRCLDGDLFYLDYPAANSHAIQGLDLADAFPLRYEKPN
jgi:hypothetical protein